MINKGALVAIFDVRIEGWGGLTLHDCKWFRNQRGSWVGMPSERYTDKLGNTRYRTLVEFFDEGAKDRFEAAALKAVEDFVEGSEPAF